ncbi:zinc metalloprotease [Mucor velutinosus]|uniref:Zinc metalloprotease n=1 Tax=Mucor velutinosus TaxID=708070 RepID=A0AAN7D5M7_9FUNG|nr:zinc metalloprotease [Mucor velutinosus]
MIFRILIILLLSTAAFQCQQLPSPSVQGINPTLDAFSTLAPIMDTVVNLARLADDLLGSMSYHRALGKEESNLPTASKTYTYSNTSDVYQEAVMYAQLCAASNCKASYDKWDCGKYCNSTVPDGVVIRAFATHPLGVHGYVLRSQKEKKLYVMLRTDSSIRDKILNLQRKLVPHPRIPGAKVQLGLLSSMINIRDIVYRTIRDQLKLHPDYQVRVAGHSYGAGIGSLLTVDLAQRLPQLNSTNLAAYLLGKPRVGNQAYATYVAEKKITIKRFVQVADDLSHLPSIADGYAHEGDEYWLSSNKTQQIVVCPGPYETKSCSSSLSYGEADDHYTYFGISQTCEDNIYNVY